MCVRRGVSIFTVIAESVFSQERGGDLFCLFSLRYVRDLWRGRAGQMTIMQCRLEAQLGQANVNNVIPLSGGSAPHHYILSHNAAPRESL